MTNVNLMDKGKLILTVNLTKQAVEEKQLYGLDNSGDYAMHAQNYLWAAHKRKERYGYYVNKDTATKNMLRALRMLPYQNTPEDWARLHITEALMKLRKK